MEKVIKPIPGFPGYLASNYGEIYSLWCGRCGETRIGESMRKLKSLYVDGRMVVTLSRNRKRVTRRVHQLVLETFVGPKPRGMVCCHFPDRSTQNNRLDNLRWDTPTSNYADRVSHGTCNRGQRNGSSRLTDNKVIAIRERLNNGEKAKTIAEENGVSISAIYQIRDRKIWQWL